MKKPKPPKTPPPPRKTPWSKFRNTTNYLSRGETETYLDAAAIGRVYSHVHALLEFEKSLEAQTAAPVEMDLDVLDNEIHLQSRKTLAGNPYELTKGQHLVPRQHLSWFARDDGQVYVLHKSYPRIKLLHPTKNHPFCAERLWSHKEELTSHPIEERFYKEADKAKKAVAEDVRHIELEQAAISEYWALVRSRVRVHACPPRPYNSPGQTRERFSQEEKDANEYEGYAMYSIEGDETRADADGVILSLMRMDLGDIELRKVRWFVAVTNDDKFVLPDLFPKFLVPISHDIMFYGIEKADPNSPSRGWVTNPDEAAELCYIHARRFVVARSEQTLLKLRPNQEGIAHRGPSKSRKRRVLELAGQGAIQLLDAILHAGTEAKTLERAKPETEAKEFEGLKVPALALGEGKDPDPDEA